MTETVSESASDGSSPTSETVGQRPGGVPEQVTVERKPKSCKKGSAKKTRFAGEAICGCNDGSCVSGNDTPPAGGQSAGNDLSKDGIRVLEYAALENYVRFFGIEPGCAMLAQIENSSSGIAGWAMYDGPGIEYIAPPMTPSRPRKEIEEERRRKKANNNTDHLMTNDGQKELMMMTTEGRMLGTCWQTVEVARPLLSVRQITSQGNRVVFGRIGGEIQSLRTGQVVKFGMEGNVYVLDLWIPPKSGFTWRGT